MTPAEEVMYRMELRVSGKAAADAKYGVPAPQEVPSSEIKQLFLSAQEQFLYQHHLTNLRTGKYVQNQDGSYSSLLNIGVGIGGREYNLPTVWDGQELSAPEAIKKAKAVGLEKFPSYPTWQEAEGRYDMMHQFMELDTPATVTEVPFK